MRGARYTGPDRRHGRARRVPAVFVAHGSPNTIFDEEFATALHRFGARQGPLDGAVVVSAHWESLKPIRVTRGVKPDLLYDFSGMPSRVESLSYSCRGSLALSDHVLALLASAGIPAVADPGRGFDHGTWVPMSLAFPSGRVPIVQVSLPAPAEPVEILQFGRALAPLRDRNVLLVGTGGIVHNLHRLRFSAPSTAPEPWALGFDQWVHEQVARFDLEALCDYRRRAPHALESAPTPEHFEPLLFVLGSRGPGDQVFDLFEGFRHGSLSMRSFAIAGRRSEDLASILDLTSAAAAATVRR
jgi:4,5-DOPA dioxygenase extradiol